MKVKQCGLRAGQCRTFRNLRRMRWFREEIVEKRVTTDHSSWGCTNPVEEQKLLILSLQTRVG